MRREIVSSLEKEKKKKIKEKLYFRFDFILSINRDGKI